MVPAATYTQGDTLPALSATIVVDDVGVDLTGTEITATMSSFGTHPVTVFSGRPVTVVDASTGQVQVVFGPGDLAAPGRYGVRFRVAWANGVEHFPTGAPLIVRVTPAT